MDCGPDARRGLIPAAGSVLRGVSDRAASEPKRAAAILESLPGGRLYHFSRSYGTTKRRAYLCEKEAIGGKNRASKTESHPRKILAAHGLCVDKSPSTPVVR
jgi:hypothetical protein